jgi:hypothetical protein
MRGRADINGLLGRRGFRTSFSHRFGRGGLRGAVLPDFLLSHMMSELRSITQKGQVG